MWTEIVLISILMVSGGLTQVITPKSKTIVISPGDSAKFECYVSSGDPSDQLMSWTKGSTTIWTQTLNDRNGNFKENYAEKYTLEKTLNEGILVVTLGIASVQPTDIDTYTCKFITKDTEKAVFNLYTHECSTVKEPISVGSNASFECVVNGKDDSEKPAAAWVGFTPSSPILNYTAQLDLMGKSETCEISAPDLDGKVTCRSFYKIKNPYEHKGLSVSPVRDGYGILMESVALVNLTCNIVKSPVSGETPELTYSWVVNEKRVEGETSRVLHLDVSQYEANGIQTMNFRVSCSATVSNIGITAKQMTFSLKETTTEYVKPVNIAESLRVCTYLMAVFVFTFLMCF